jgi:hypothetical protein
MDENNTATTQTAPATTSKGPSPSSIRRKNRKSRKLRNRNRKYFKNNRKSTPQSQSQTEEDSNPEDGSVKSEKWLSTYESLVKWHNTNHLKNVAQNLRLENELLKQRLNDARRLCPIEQDSSSDTDSDDKKVDAKYLEFLEITEKHKLEVRLKKEKQNTEENENE